MTIETQDSLRQMMVSREDNKGKKKKEVTCFMCKKVEHYLNKCDKDEKTLRTSRKKGSNLKKLDTFIKDSKFI